MTIIAIHQPNYLPWLGYFAKIAQADIFVFLDDVQYSKGSYTNRVQIARNGEPVWLTQAVKHEFGASINAVEFARTDWARAHADTLRQTYRGAACFGETWPVLSSILSASGTRLASVNARIVTAMSERLGFTGCRFVASSELAIANCTSADERLARIVNRLMPGATYLSGAGGDKYQAEAMFAAHGVTLGYSAFKQRAYDRGGEPFLSGLSIVDAVFHLGWQGAADLIRGCL